MYFVTGAITVSNLIAITSLVSEIWLATDRQTDRHRDDMTSSMLTFLKRKRKELLNQIRTLFVYWRLIAPLEHAKQLLKLLHWLPNKERIVFKSLSALGFSDATWKCSEQTRRNPKSQWNCCLLFSGREGCQQNRHFSEGRFGNETETGAFWKRDRDNEARHTQPSTKDGNTRKRQTLLCVKYCTQKRRCHHKEQLKQLKTRKHYKAGEVSTHEVLHTETGVTARSNWSSVRPTNIRKLARIWSTHKVLHGETDEVSLQGAVETV